MSLFCLQLDKKGTSAILSGTWIFTGAFYLCIPGILTIEIDKEKIGFESKTKSHAFQHWQKKNESDFVDILLPTLAFSESSSSSCLIAEPYKFCSGNCRKSESLDSKKIKGNYFYHLHLLNPLVNHTTIKLLAVFFIWETAQTTCNVTKIVSQSKYAIQQ